MVCMFHVLLCYLFIFCGFDSLGFGSNTDIQMVIDKVSRSFDHIPDDFEASRRCALIPGDLYLIFFF